MSMTRELLRAKMLSPRLQEETCVSDVDSQLPWSSSLAIIAWRVRVRNLPVMSTSMLSARTIFIVVCIFALLLVSDWWFRVC